MVIDRDTAVLPSRSPNLRWSVIWRPRHHSPEYALWWLDPFRIAAAGAGLAMLACWAALVGIPSPGRTRLGALIDDGYLFEVLPLRRHAVSDFIHYGFMASGRGRQGSMKLTPALDSSCHPAGRGPTSS